MLGWLVPSMSSTLATFSTTAGVAGVSATGSDGEGGGACSTSLIEVGISLGLKSVGEKLTKCFFSNM